MNIKRRQIKKISVEEIDIVLSTLEYNNAIGLDGINNELYKQNTYE